MNFVEMAELYSLDRLEADLAADFEEHFLQCPRCAALVESEQIFVETFRATFR